MDKNGQEAPNQAFLLSFEQVRHGSVGKYMGSGPHSHSVHQPYRAHEQEEQNQHPKAAWESVGQSLKNIPDIPRIEKSEYQCHEKEKHVAVVGESRDEEL